MGSYLTTGSFISPPPACVESKAAAAERERPGWPGAGYLAWPGDAAEAFCRFATPTRLL